MPRQATTDCTFPYSHLKVCYHANKAVSASCTCRLQNAVSDTNIGAAQHTPRHTDNNAFGTAIQLGNIKLRNANVEMSK